MSTTIKKMMGLELEFIDSTTNGFIKWIDLITGDDLAVFGLGSTGQDEEGNDTGGDKFLELNISELDYIKVTGGDLVVDNDFSTYISGLRNEVNYTISELTMNHPDYKAIEKASVEIPFIEDVRTEDADGVVTYTPQTQTDRYIEIEELKEEYVSNTNALLFEHENAIAFANPITGRLLGEIDVHLESFSWYGGFSLGGEPVDDSYLEIKRTMPNKYNLTLNADTNNIASLGFKKEDSVAWIISAKDDLDLKDINGNGISISNDKATFSGEIIYFGKPLLDYFYTQDQLDTGVLDPRYYTEVELDAGQLDNRYYTETEIDNNIYTKIELDAGQLDDIYYTEVELDAGQLDDRYYTEVEIDNNIYTKIEIDNKLYTQTEVDSIIQSTKLPLDAEILSLQTKVGIIENSVSPYVNELYTCIDLEWVNITDTIINIDEYDDKLMVSPVENDIVYAELEDRYYNSSWSIQSVTTVTSKDDLPWIIQPDEIAIRYRYNKVYKWSGTSWVEDNTKTVEDYYTESLHLSSITIPIEGTLYKITSTNKFYEYVNGEFLISECPVPDLYSLPVQTDITDRIIHILNV